jgi:hypothetical protein
VLDAIDEEAPFGWRKDEDWAADILAVADGYVPVRGCSSHFDAIWQREAVRASVPLGIRAAAVAVYLTNRIYLLDDRPTLYNVRVVACNHARAVFFVMTSSSYYA